MSKASPSQPQDTATEQQGDGTYGDGLQVQPAPGGIYFSVRVSPRAAKARVLGIHDGCLKLSLTAAPADGAANRALIALLSKVLSVPKTAIEIRGGLSARTKRIYVANLSATDLRKIAP